MKPALSRTAGADFAAKLARQVLVCPDCGSPVSEELACPSCRRSLAPDADGIIAAMPASLTHPASDARALEGAIEATSGAVRSEQIVAYEQLFHDEQAPHYDHLLSDPLPIPVYYDRLIRHQVYSHVKDFGCVVDLCCGTGKSSLPLLEKGMPIVAIDVSRQMLLRYRDKCRSRGLDKVVFVQGDATRPPLAPRSCEAIMMIGGLHHVPDQDKCLANCGEALAPNGLLILHEPLKTGQTSRTAALLDNVYALCDIGRVLRALRRRIGLQGGSNPNSAAAAEPVPHFTPYEQPFTSAEGLTAIAPPSLETVVLRSQAVLSCHEFPPVLQGKFGHSLARVIVHLDERMNTREQWSGDALFAVFRKTAQGPMKRQ